MSVYECIWEYLSVWECKYIHTLAYTHIHSNTLKYTHNIHIHSNTLTYSQIHTNTLKYNRILPSPQHLLAYESFQTLQNQLGDEPTLAFSTSWLSLHTGHQRIYTNFNSTRRVVFDIGAKKGQKERHRSFCTHPFNLFYLRQQPHEFMWLSWVFVSVC